MVRKTIHAAAIVCLGFTPAWADDSQDEVILPPIQEGHGWVDDPFAPHDTTGAEVRVGTLVAVVALDEQEYTGLGASVAAGHRWGRLAIDAEYGYLEITERGPSSLRYGVAHHLGVNVRAELIRLGSRTMGPNSMAGLYVEANVGRQLRDPDEDRPDDRRIPGGGSTQIGAGGGIMFDHRLEQPRGFPNRVGWQLGWRIVGSPRPQPDSFASCLGSECTAMKESGGSPMMELGFAETSLVLASSLAFTW